MQEEQIENLILRSTQLLEKGRFAEAASAAHLLLTRDQVNREGLQLLGNAYHALGETEAALYFFSRGCELYPGIPLFQNNRGLLLRESGRLSEALEAFAAAIALNPDYYLPWYNMGLVRQDQQSVTEAIHCYKKALQLNPRHLASYTNLGLLQAQQVDFAAAVETYEQGLKAYPDDIKLLSSISSALTELGLYGKALAYCNRALMLAPDQTELLTIKGIASYKTGKALEAVQCFRKAMTLADDSVSGRRLYDNILLAMHYTNRYSADEIAEEHRQWARLFASSHFRTPIPAKADEPQRPLQVGYVSPDFCAHPVAFFIEPILASHDQASHKIFCYANVSRPDSITAQLQLLPIVWRDISSLTDAECAELIKNDGIDILVDLAGHTCQNRLPLFTLKPAPLQVTWLGYPDTTGVAAIDYRFSDVVADPVGMTERHHSEELVRLPGTFLCFRPPANAPAVVEREHLTARPLTFSSFNNLAKVSPEMMAVWANILLQVADATLLIKAFGLEDESIREEIRSVFRACGIPDERVILLGRTPNVLSHLTMLSQTDIALDTFPYNGTTTTCEALWMGVPVVTLSGSTHVSRVGASILRSVGLSELVAQTENEYLELAVQLAKNRERLARYRRDLRNMMLNSTLLDAATFTRNLEQAYRTMWRRWCSQDSGRNLITPDQAV